MMITLNAVLQAWPHVEALLAPLLASPLLKILTVLSVAFLLALCLAPKRAAVVKQICLFASLLSLFIGVVACSTFNKLSSGYQFSETLMLVEHFNFSLAIGVDGISLVFLLLTLFTFPLFFLSAWGVQKAPKQFFCHLLGMEILLVLTFVVLDLLYFFVFFESLLIPMFILIGVWGARNRKIKAAYYFFLYTLFGSLFMLFAMIYLYQIIGSLNYYTLLHTALRPAQQELIWACFFLAFAIKMPLFPFHIWLPEAHVEAPTTGSMLLASLLLKLGGYGFLRFSLTFLGGASETYSPFVVALALAGVIYGSLSTLRQIDLKRIIAYSSVSHMNLVVLGLFSFTQQGVEGAIYLMVAHGVVSAALFYCVGVLYDRTRSRLLRYYGGLVTVMPLFAAAFFVFSLANMSFPGTPNFVGELLMFVGVFERSILVLFYATAGIVLAAAFSVFLYNRVVFGTLKTKFAPTFTDITRLEAKVILLLVTLTILLGLVGNTVLEFIHLVVLELNSQYSVPCNIATALPSPIPPRKINPEMTAEISANLSAELNNTVIVPKPPTPEFAYTNTRMRPGYNHKFEILVVYLLVAPPAMYAYYRSLVRHEEDEYGNPITPRDPIQSPDPIQATPSAQSAPSSLSTPSLLSTPSAPPSLPPRKRVLRSPASLA